MWLRTTMKPYGLLNKPTENHTEDRGDHRGSTCPSTLRAANEPRCCR